MTMSTDCSQNTDPLKLVREGTSQDGRQPDALDPAYAPVNERTVAHGMVFAQSYAALLQYFDENNAPKDDWAPFFDNDVSVQLAIAAIEDVEAYKTNTQSWFGYLNRLENQSNQNGLKDRFGLLYGSVATLAQQLDKLKEGLPADIALKGTLQNLIKSQLAPAFKRLIAYYKAGVTRTLVDAVVPSPAVQVLRCSVAGFDTVLSAGLSGDWSEGLPWPGYVGGIAEDDSVYGDAASVFSQINHCSTHNLYTSVFDQFLKVFARVVGEAKTSLDLTLTDWDRHEPHYALYLAFLRLFEYARASSNTLTQRHLDFYFRQVLCLEEKGAEPGHVHLLTELAKQVSSHEFKAGEFFKAGKDEQGRDAFFANTSDFVANQAKVAALKTVYRHGDELLGSSNIHKGRLYASPAANSEDGLGAALTSVDQSWQPFFNKVYADGALVEIRMPEAEVGFAIASHYLLMAEGQRRIVATIKVSSYSGTAGQEFRDDIRCLLTTEKGWLERAPLFFHQIGADVLRLVLDISGADAPITRYSAKTHGYAFQTDSPMLLVKLKQDDARTYAYPALQNVVVTAITLFVTSDNVKSLAVSTDFGPVDTSKPFQPFGPSPVTGNSLIIGSREIFQKKLRRAQVNLDWLTPPHAYASPVLAGTLPTVGIDFLSAGQWMATTMAYPVGSAVFPLTANLDLPVLAEADFGADEPYSTQSRHGFARLRLTGNFGQDAYQSDLLKYLRKDGSAADPGKQPMGPTASALSMSYAASSELVLNTSTTDSYETRPGQFFYLAPFGAAEQHPYLNSGKPVHLFPQFDFERDNASAESEAELYVGISGLKPPQTLCLLFQVAAGTANPMVPKPKPHIDWCYLKNNEWAPFARNEVQDETGELLNSGIVTFAVPRDATSDNSLLQSGLFWIRAAVSERSDAVCMLQLVAAQAMQASFVNQGNSPGFGAIPLAAGTIKKLDKPDSSVKTISQPFPSFGGRGAEKPTAFYTRISERLRHKDRAIDLWDYERLVLEAFPQIYQVKCLNHTQYDEGIYRELAPGHVTVVTIPNLQTQNLRDPLKPFTSLGVLQQIQAFLEKRTGCFVRLHVKNPQFEEVRVRFKLRLYDGFDESYYSNLLKQAITRFLSPWAFADGGPPSFGGKIYKSVLINFIEDQSYVDYVTDFELFQNIGGVQGSRDLDEVAGSTAVSILVSVPAGKHEITIIKDTLDIPSGESCVCEA
jgi:hypothetical protein